MNEKSSPDNKKAVTIINIFAGGLFKKLFNFWDRTKQFETAVVSMDINMVQVYKIPSRYD
ncbi:MAG: hypothetical protein SOZ34_05985 [Clostridia bacterium]|nr:hypothetical protein [Clostridia bacterium]